MADETITYAMIRAVREDTGASHDECRQVLERTDGDIAKASALWFSEKRKRRSATTDAPSGSE